MGALTVAVNAERDNRAVFRFESKVIDEPGNLPKKLWQQHVLHLAPIVTLRRKSRESKIDGFTGAALQRALV